MWLSMNCKGILGSLTDYLHGETGKKVCSEIDRHLDGCKRCRMHVDSMKLIITLYKRWRVDTIPRDTSIRLQQVIAEEACRLGAGKPRRKKTQTKARKDPKAPGGPAR
jgi:predicted anti-sigma-YlaC factor YlaD